MHAGDAEEIQGLGRIVGKLGHRVVACDGIAAAMAAHVEAQDAIAGGQQRRQLLRPHAAVGCQGVGKTDDGGVLWPDQIVIKIACGAIDQHA